MTRLRVTVALPALLLAACGQGTPGSGSGMPGRGAGPGVADSGPPRDWSGFPVDAKPRPIVLIGDRTVVAGFTTEQGKIAFLAGQIELAATPPPGPRTVLAHLPDGDATLPTVTGAEAYAELLADARETDAKPEPGAPPLRLTSVAFGTAEFLTDRGRLPLPAWLFDGPELIDPLAWPALAPSAFWQFDQEQLPAVLGENRLSPDRRTLTVTLPSPEPPCPGGKVMRVDPVAEEAAATVTVVVRQVVVSEAPQSPGECVHDLVLRTAPYTLRLSAPLGNRVVVDERGDALTITLT